jgi:hypothetical protein
MSNSDHRYSFYTSEKDRFLRRIAEEAPADTDFILVERTNRKEKKIRHFLLISKKFLSDGRLGPDAAIGGFGLNPYWGTDHTDRFRVQSWAHTDEGASASLREQIEKAKASLLKPAVHVTVEYL